MNNSDDNFLKDAINASFNEIDKGIQASDFHEDWQLARAALEQQPTFLQKLFPESLFMAFRRPLFSPPVLLIAPVCLLIVAILVLMENRGPSDDLVIPYSTSAQEKITSLDPNTYWRAPTDELLQIDVRKYETQLVTFVNYDPLSMEIR
jgi:hypothetical protein